MLLSGQKLFLDQIVKLSKCVYLNIGSYVRAKRVEKFGDSDSGSQRAVV